MKRTAWMRSPRPSPSTCPSRASRPSRSPSTVTTLSELPAPVGGDHHEGSSVLAVRRSPSCSDIENWLSRYPRTAPLAR